MRLHAPTPDHLRGPTKAGQARRCRAPAVWLWLALWRRDVIWPPNHKFVHTDQPPVSGPANRACVRWVDPYGAAPHPMQRRIRESCRPRCTHASHAAVSRLLPRPVRDSLLVGLKEGWSLADWAGRAVTASMASARPVPTRGCGSRAARPRGDHRHAIPGHSALPRAVRPYPPLPPRRWLIRPRNGRPGGSACACQPGSRVSVSPWSGATGPEPPAPAWQQGPVTSSRSGTSDSGPARRPWGQARL
jgi:hypothetical protein